MDGINGHFGILTNASGRPSKTGKKRRPFPQNTNNNQNRTTRGDKFSQGNALSFFQEGYIDDKGNKTVQTVQVFSRKDYDGPLNGVSNTVIENEDGSITKKTVEIQELSDGNIQITTTETHTSAQNNVNSNKVLLKGNSGNAPDASGQARFLVSKHPVVNSQSSNNEAQTQGTLLTFDQDGSVLMQSQRVTLTPEEQLKAANFRYSNAAYHMQEDVGTTATANSAVSDMKNGMQQHVANMNKNNEQLKAAKKQIKDLIKSLKKASTKKAANEIFNQINKYVQGLNDSFYAPNNAIFPQLNTMLSQAANQCNIAANIFTSAASLFTCFDYEGPTAEMQAWQKQANELFPQVQANKEQAERTYTEMTNLVSQAQAEVGQSAELWSDIQQLLQDANTALENWKKKK